MYQWHFPEFNDWLQQDYRYTETIKDFGMSVARTHTGLGDYDVYQLKFLLPNHCFGGVVTRREALYIKKYDVASLRYWYEKVMKLILSFWSEYLFSYFQGGYFCRGYHINFKEDDIVMFELVSAG